MLQLIKTKYVFMRLRGSEYYLDGWFAANKKRITWTGSDVCWWPFSTHLETETTRDHRFHGSFFFSSGLTSFFFSLTDLSSDSLVPFRFWFDLKCSVGISSESVSSSSSSTFGFHANFSRVSPFIVSNFMFIWLNFVKSG